MSSSELYRLVGAIQLGDMTTYLGANGWQLDPSFPRKEVLLFLGPLADDGEPVEIALPASQTAADFPARVRDAIITLAALAERDELDVARDVCRSGR